MTIDEGYTKFECDWTECELPKFRETDELCRWRRPLHDAGLIGIYADAGIGFGNISMRIGSGPEFLISGTQTGHLRDVGPQHFSLVTNADPERNRVSCRGPVQASSESMTHAALYQTDSSIMAVVHVHSKLLWNGLAGLIPTTDPAVAYGTPEMAREFARLWRESDFRTTGIAVMGGHEEGLVSIGETMAVAATKILELQERLP
ncbi:MAG: class II aldolase/adducin family protein [Woeseiaceae bacterium]|nr:class II aldolase/adducin family protein [Woeseiaceae bacterium]